MKNILIPMDFSPVALNALRYGLKIFENERIYIIHATMGSSFTDAMDDHSRFGKKEVLRKELEKDVLGVLELTELPDKITVDVIHGEIKSAINTYCKEQLIDAVVMGTRDKYDLFDKWLGTVSLSVIKTLSVPIYLIPPFAIFKEIKNTLVASDAHLRDIKLIRWIKEWNWPHQSFVRFLHIRNNDIDTFTAEKTQIIEGFFEEDDPTFGFEIISKSSKDISESVLAAAYNYGSDMLIAIPDNQNFFNTLMFKSISKELILKSKIPILFISPTKIDK